MSIETVIRLVAVGAVAYVIGSIPFPFIWTLIIARRDLRKLGTGNITVYNSFRGAGWIPALLTVLSNAGLGFAVVVLATWLVPEDDYTFVFGRIPENELTIIAIIVGLISVTVGAMWPIWLAFSGGIGTTTMGWTMMFIWPPLPFAILGVWFLSLIVTRRTFTSSTVVYRTLPIILGLVTQSWLFAIAGLVLSALLHVKRKAERDDGSELGVWRRLGMNKT